MEEVTGDLERSRGDDWGIRGGELWRAQEVTEHRSAMGVL